MHTLKQSIINPNWYDVGYHTPNGDWVDIQNGMAWLDAMALVNRLNGGGGGGGRVYL